MILSKIWERYIFKEFIKVFSFFLFSFYLLFIIIDYSINSQNLLSPDLTFWNVIVYYANNFVVQASTLLPVTISIATTRVLYQLNISHQIVAFLVSGIRKIHLLRPLFFVAGICMLFLYVSFEFIYPKALQGRTESEEQIFTSLLSPPIKVVNIPNNTKILYQTYDRTLNAFLDVYWVQSLDHIEHMSHLYPFEDIPYGLSVDILTRNKDGFLELSDSKKRINYNKKLLSPKVLKMKISDIQMQSISKLWTQATYYTTKHSDRHSKILSTFFVKLVLPLGCILAVLIPASMCLSFSRKVPIFFIYSFTFFSILVFFTLMDTAQVLAESHVFPIIPCVFAPLVIYFIFFGWRFSKIS